MEKDFMKLPRFNEPEDRRVVVDGCCHHQHRTGLTAEDRRVPKELEAMLREAKGAAELAEILRQHAVESIEQTKRSTESGGVNVWTMTLKNGKTYTLEVRNGDIGRPGFTEEEKAALVSELNEAKDAAESAASEANTAAENAATATNAVNTAANNANEKASLAEEKAGIAETAAGSATDAAASAKESASNANEAASNANEAAVRAEGAADKVEDNITLNTEMVQTAVQESAEAKCAADDAVFRAQGAVGTANSAALVAQQAKVIAEGRATGYVFDTLTDMNAWLAVAENVAKLHVGDNLYIRDTSVSDYWWDGESIQKLETEHPDLSGYVKNTDYATTSIAGVVKLGSGNLGITINSNGVLFISRALNHEIILKKDVYKPITCQQIDMAVKVGLTTNAFILTDIEKANAKKWLGFSPLTQDEYEALTDKSGINFVIPEDYDNQ